MCQSYLNLQRYQIIEEKSLIENNIPFITDKQVFLPFIGTMLSEKTMLNPSRVVTYAISEKDYDKTLLTDELMDPNKQVRLELWAYSPKQFSEDNSADDISLVLSFKDTNDERIEEAVDELQERRLHE